MESIEALDGGRPHGTEEFEVAFVIDDQQTLQDLSEAAGARFYQHLLTVLAVDGARDDVPSIRNFDPLPDAIREQASWGRLLSDNFRAHRLVPKCAEIVSCLPSLRALPLSSDAPTSLRR